LLSTDFGQSWTTYEIVNQETGQSIEQGVRVLSAKIIDNEIWVGTEDGIAVSSDGIDWDIFRTFERIEENAPDEERSYVSPNPYSPYIEESGLKFHYRLEKGGDVTIRIFDFANNLVKLIADAVPRDADVQYNDLDIWTGLNENGDTVAGGVYIYLIESSGGDELWGKIMVIP